MTIPRNWRETKGVFESLISSERFELTETY